MLMPASPEFVALCRSQVALLTQTLGATLSVVYLTEDLTGATEPNLVPVVAYPEAAASWPAAQVLQLMSRGMQGKFPALRLLSAGEGEIQSHCRDRFPRCQNQAIAPLSLLVAVAVLPIDRPNAPVAAMCTRWNGGIWKRHWNILSKSFCR